MSGHSQTNWDEIGAASPAGRRISGERWRQVKEALNAALELGAADRATFLDEVCSQDSELRREVESLLKSYEQAGDFLDTPASSLAADPPPVPPSGDPLIGSLVGRYRLIGKIGHGGMGTVYRAVRADDQFDFQVAIKLISRGMDTDFIVSRFRNERQILASLDHPHIARLLDGGATVDGLPYFVMEYIDGQPLHVWCDQHKLSITERLNLFRQVCSAVHYAHQNLIVHRDLKPTNILVTGDGTLKLLDFGIAKILSLELAQHTIDPTLSIYRMMTPEYASPEQARGEAITTASDVYSLGVLLYELLTGRRPYRIVARAPKEIEQVICGRQPERPSTAVHRVEDVKGVALTPEVISETREGTPDKLRRRLRGDLDNIVLMAMRKEPQRRYSSVEQFSEDIRRHLEGFAVLARADAFGYRAGKFIGRHTAGVAAALLVVLALIAGIIATSYQAHVANRERARAEHRFNDVRRLANSVMFEVHDKIAQLPGSTPARELIVSKALEYIDNLAHEAAGDPGLQAELANVYIKIGDVQGRPYQPNLGRTADALASYGKALEIRRTLLAINPSNEDSKRSLATSLESMCGIYEAMGNSSEALKHCEQALGLRQSLYNLHPDERLRRFELGSAYQYYANALALGGDWSRVKENRRQALAIFSRLAADDPADDTAQHNVATAYMKLGRTMALMGDWAPALEAERSSLALHSKLLKTAPADPTHQMNVSFACFFLGWIQGEMGNIEQALASERRALDIRKELADLDPSDARIRTELAATHAGIGDLLLRSGRTRAALGQYRQALAIDQALANSDPLRAEHQGDLAKVSASIGSVYLRMAESRGGRAENLREARRWFVKARDIYQRLSDRGALIAEFAGGPPTVARLLAECDGALAK